MPSPVFGSIPNVDYTQVLYSTANIAIGTGTGAVYSNVDATNAKITFTPPSAGRYKVTFTFSHHVDGTAVDIFFRLSDGTTASQGFERYNPSGATVQVITISHVFTCEPVATTVTLQKRIVAGTITTNQIPCNAATNVEIGLEMLVERL